MQGIVALIRVVFVVALSLTFIDAAAAQQEIATDAGVITEVATVEAIDVTNQLVTVVGPDNNWVVVKVTPEHIKLIKLKEKITISYSNEVAVALRRVRLNPSLGTLSSRKRPPA